MTRNAGVLGTFMHAEYLARAVSLPLLALPISFHSQKPERVWDRIIRAGNAVSTIIEQVIP